MPNLGKVLPGQSSSSSSASTGTSGPFAAEALTSLGHLPLTGPLGGSPAPLGTPSPSPALPAEREEVRMSPLVEHGQVPPSKVAHPLRQLLGPCVLGEAWSARGAWGYEGALRPRSFPAQTPQSQKSKGGDWRSSSCSSPISEKARSSPRNQIPIFNPSSNIFSCGVSMPSTKTPDPNKLGLVWGCG